MQAIRRHLQQIACICLAAWLCSLRFACAFHPASLNYPTNARQRSQRRHVRISGAGLGYTHSRSSSIRSIKLQFQGDDRISGLLSESEKIRLEELECIVPPPGIQDADVGMWTRISQKLWPRLLSSGVQRQPDLEAEDTFIEQLQHTLFNSEMDTDPTNATTSTGEELSFPREWVQKVNANNNLLEDFVAEAAELSSATGAATPDVLLESPASRKWVRRLMQRYDPLHPAYSRAFVDSNLALHEALKPQLAPGHQGFMKTLAAAPTKFMNALRAALPPVAGLTAAMVAPTRQPIARAAAALFGAFAGGRVSQRLRYARQLSVFESVAEATRNNQTISIEARGLLQQRHFLSEEDMSIVLMAIFGDELIRIVVETPIVGAWQIDLIVDLSKRLCLSEMEIAHAVWKVTQLWHLLFSADDEIDFAFRNYPTVDDAADAKAIHTIWQDLAKEDDLARPTILWLGYHAQMLEAVWKMKRSSSIRGSNLLQQVSQRIGLQKLAGVLVQVLQKTLSPPLSFSCEQWVLGRLKVAPEEITKYQEHGDDRLREYALVLHEVATSMERDHMPKRLQQAQRTFGLSAEKLSALHAAALTVAVDDAFQGGGASITADTGELLAHLQATLNVSNADFANAYRSAAAPVLHKHGLELVAPRISDFEIELNSTAEAFAKLCRDARVPEPVIREILTKIGEDVQEKSLRQSFGGFVHHKPDLRDSYMSLLFVGLGRERTQMLAKACGVPDLKIPVGDIQRYSALISDLATAKTIAGTIERSGYISPIERRQMQYTRDFLDQHFFKHFESAAIVDQGLYDSLRAYISSGRLNETDKVGWQKEYDKYVFDLDRVNDSIAMLYGMELDRALAEPTPDQAFLAHMQWFLDVPTEVAERLHEEKLGIVYQREVEGILTNHGVVDEIAAKQLAELQSTLLLTNDSAARLFNAAVRTKIEETVDVLAYEYDTSTLSTKDFKEKYGEAVEISRLGLRGRVSFMAEAMKLTKLLRDNNVPIIDERGQMTLPVSASNHSLNRTKKELYKYYMMCIIVETDPALKQQYEADKTLFAYAVGVPPTREKELRQELLQYFTRRVLAFSVVEYGSVGFEYFKVIQDIQATLGIPEADAQRIVRQIKIDLVRHWIKTSKKGRAVDVGRRIRMALNDFQIDPVTDVGIDDESRAFMYGRELQEVVEYQLPLETLPVARAAWKLTAQQAAEQAKRIVEKKLEILLALASHPSPKTLKVMSQQEMIEISIRYADAHPEPFQFPLASNRVTQLPHIYARILFGNKPPWMVQDAAKHQKYEKLRKLMEHATLTSPQFA